MASGDAHGQGVKTFIDEYIPGLEHVLIAHGGGGIDIGQIEGVISRS